MLEINSDGTVQENKDEQLMNHFNEETQLMTRNVESEPKWGSHIGVEKVDGKTSV